MRVFFIGVCGTAMGNAAILFKKMGHAVAGSDAGVYPPMSDVLESAGIKLLEGFAQQDMLDWQPDRVVVGNAVSRGNPQVEYLLRTRQIDFVSLPQLIGEDLIGKRPAIDGGTHGDYLPHSPLCSVKGRTGSGLSYWRGTLRSTIWQRIRFR